MTGLVLPPWGGPLIALCYLVLGHFALALALPPGYASPVFLPAGLAVTCAMLYGRRALPWLALGSFGLNLWIDPAHAGSIAPAALIAAASTLQAALGGSVLRRSLGGAAPMLGARAVARYLVIAPVACLVASTLAVGGLRLLGRVPAPEFAANWVSWWVGDTLGVLVMLPIVLATVGQPREHWQRRRLRVVVPMVLTLAVLVFFYLRMSQWERDDELESFRGMSQQLAAELQLRYSEQEILLEQLDGFMVHDTEHGVSRAGFRRYVRNALERFGNVQAVEWAPLVPLRRRAAFEQAQATAAGPLAIRERDATGHFVTAGPRERYAPVAYVEPLAGNEPALGFDLLSQEARARALRRAEAVRGAVLTAPVRLVQERGSQSGALLLRAVRADGDVLGYVLTVLRLSDFTRGAIGALGAWVQVQFIDRETGEAIYADFADPGARPLYVTQLTLGTRHFELRTRPTPAYLAAHRGWQSFSLLAVGLFGDALLGAMLLLITGYAANSERMVQRRTVELRASEAELRRLYTEQKASELELKTARERLALSLQGADLALADWEIPADRLVLGEGWSRLLGLAPEALPRSTVALAPLAHPDDLAPTRDAMVAHLKGRTPQFEQELRMRHAAGHWVWVHVRGMAVERDAQGRATRVSGTAMDVTQRKTMEQELKRLATIDNLTGLANRRHFIEQLALELARVRRLGHASSLLMLDLDHFKRINDAFGHATGDAVLRDFAEALRGGLRAIDFSGRLGGEEFGIVLQGAALDDARGMAARLVAEVAARPVRSGEAAVRYTVSVGVTELRGADDHPDAVLARADAALYRAKQHGRDRVEA